MDKLLSVKDVCERYRIKDRKARAIMRDEMPHIERPKLYVTERAVLEWERRNTLPPERGQHERHTVRRN